MTTYRTKDGAELLVCDTCGIDHTGAKPDITGATAVDVTAGMVANVFPAGTTCTVTDTCPDCTQRQGGPTP